MRPVNREEYKHGDMQQRYVKHCKSVGNAGTDNSHKASAHFAVVFYRQRRGLVGVLEQAREMRLVVKTAAVNDVGHTALRLLLQTLISGL